ncbi:MAG: D-2-hydroxyacid dehydrogenase [Bacteroidaceae bacterium]|nr:D-2-hydroxyacid dehydrogenase [Bacteroidaceae bacterium]
MPTIVFLDSNALAGPGDLDWRPLREAGQFTEYPRTPQPLIAERTRGAEIVITNKCRLTADVLREMPTVRLILEAATGFDNIDVAAARALGIDVCNVAGYARLPVAQSIVAMLLDHCNRIADYARESREGQWAACKDFCLLSHPTVELDGKRISIVGFGSIGSALADMLQPFGAEVCAVTSKPQEALPTGVTKVSLDEALATSFALSLNCPLTPANRGFVNAALLAKARRGLVLINTARGAVVNDADVAAALADGTLGAYYADVLTDEPPRPDNPLLTAPRSFITPHVAWATREARTRIIEALAANARAYATGQPLQNVVN